MSFFWNKVKNNFMQKKDINTKFKDNQQRFRFFNKFHKQPHVFTFCFLTAIGIVLAILPFFFPGFKMTFDGWMLWGFGIGSTILFEAVANIHYWKYSKIANKRTYSNVKFNVILNQVIRYIAMSGWIWLSLAVGVIAFSKTGTLASIW